jgi:uncharacterized NAD(P)/FAD-binding protein YdhS
LLFQPLYGLFAMKKIVNMSSRSVRRKLFRLAIIGGGPNGISTLGNLKETMEKIAAEKDIGVFLEVVILDPHERPLLKGPFSRHSPSIHVCNQRSFSMGWSYSHVRDFRSWLEQKHPGKDEEFLTHPPRGEFGAWLEDQYFQIAESFSGFGSIRHVTQAVVGLEEKANNVLLQLANGTSDEFDAVVLANSNKQTRFPEMAGVPGFYKSAYPLNRIVDVQRDKEVAIIGSSLSAIDCANGLYHFGHQATKIKLFSRTGLIPATLCAGIDYKPFFLNRERLEAWANAPELSIEQVASGIRQEIQMAVTGLDLQKWYQSFKPLPTKDFLDQQLHACRYPQTYQSVLRMLFTEGLADKVYQNLPIEQRLILKESSLYKSYRHPMAPPTARNFKAVVDAGCLVFAGLQTVKRSGNRFVLERKDNRGRSCTSYFDAVIDATGGTDSLLDPRYHCPLIKSIFATGLSAPHRAGGLEIEVPTLRLRKSNRVYALGQLISGSFLYVSGMDAIARTTKQVAESIAEQIFSDNRTIFSSN